MYRYAINPSKELTICDCEVIWREDLGWTEEIYTGNIYRCKIVLCPYIDAILNDFEVNEETIIFNKNSYLKRISADRLENLRIKRQSLLLAFDKYKSNVLIGIEKDTVLREQILKWYHNILELDENAIDNPPQRIQYYIV